jgi:hypothetical protein
MRGKLFWASAAMAAMVLAGCGGEKAVGTATGGGDITAETGTAGDGEAGRVTIKANGASVTIEPLGKASSFLNIQSDRMGHAAIRSGTCENLRKILVDLGEFSTLLASEVKIAFEELTGGGHALTIGDSFCVELKPT